MAQHRIKIRHQFITRLLVSHILLASIPILITATVLIQTVHKTVENTINHRNIQIARHLAQNIEYTIEHARKILEYNASDILSMLENHLTQDIVINTIVNDFPIFRDIKLLDDSGQVLISSMLIPDIDCYRNQHFVAEVLSGKKYQSEVRIYDDALPVIDLAEPVRSYNEITGVLLAAVNLKEMWDLVQQSAIGQQGQAFIFDNTGRYIAHSERKLVYLKERFSEEPILQDIRLEKNSQRIYKNHSGIKMIAAYVSLPQLHWGVVVQQPVAEAFDVARKMKMQTLTFVGISILLSSLIAFIYTRWIVTPVNKLVSGMEKFSTEDLQYRIPSIGNDEISMLAERFNEMAEKLIAFQEKVKKSERLEILNKMASVFSHEIKNPLNAMVVNMRVIERELEKTQPRVEKLRHYLNIVGAEVKRVDDLVNDFLKIGRPPRLEKVLTDIDQVVDELIISQQAKALESGIRINRRYSRTPIAVSIDITKIKQALLNIMINAFQAMPGGGSLTIELDDYGNETATSWIVIRFRDTGKGIAKDKLFRIFDFYYSTKMNGTGLGLSIAQQIIEEHGGKIEVESEVGKGSVFSIYLPMGKNSKKPEKC